MVGYATVGGVNVDATASATVTPEPEIDFTSWQHMTRTLAHYELAEQIGEGTYGQVYKAVCLDTGRTVALKKMRLHHGGYWGMPLQMIREIKILKRLQHPNLLKMFEVVTSKGVEYLDRDDEPSKSNSKQENSNSKNDKASSSKKKDSKNDKAADAREGYKGNLFLVLEYVSHDLTGLMDVAYSFTPVQVKCIFRQLLSALAFMHSKKYVHRDIKSSNILLDRHFRVKLADFGLARSIEPFDLDFERTTQLDLTNKVITLWYRPPEILVGAIHYNGAVDVWSAGCILAELLLGKPLFAGKTELEQLLMIMELLGSPSEKTWEYLKSQKKVQSGEMKVNLNKQKPSRLRDKYKHKIKPDTALNLLEKLLAWDPRQRLTAENALGSRYFRTQPVAPDNPADLGEIQHAGGDFHEFGTKKKRRQAKVVAEEAKEKAKSKGCTEEEAREEFDRVYRGLMKKVAKEGLDGNLIPDQKGENKRKEQEEKGLLEGQKEREADAIKTVGSASQEIGKNDRYSGKDHEISRPHDHNSRNRDKGMRDGGDRDERTRLLNSDRDQRYEDGPRRENDRRQRGEERHGNDDSRPPDGRPDDRYNWRQDMRVEGGWRDEPRRTEDRRRKDLSRPEGGSREVEHRGNGRGRGDNFHDRHWRDKGEESRWYDEERQKGTSIHSDERWRNNERARESERDDRRRDDMRHDASQRDNDDRRSSRRESDGHRKRRHRDRNDDVSETKKSSSKKRRKSEEEDRKLHRGGKDDNHRDVNGGSHNDRVIEGNKMNGIPKTKNASQLSQEEKQDGSKGKFVEQDQGDTQDHSSEYGGRSQSSRRRSSSKKRDRRDRGRDGRDGRGRRDRDRDRRHFKDRHRRDRDVGDRDRERGDRGRGDRDRERDRESHYQNDRHGSSYPHPNEGVGGYGPPFQQRGNGPPDREFFNRPPEDRGRERDRHGHHSSRHSRDHGRR